MTEEQIQDLKRDKLKSDLMIAERKLQMLEIGLEKNSPFGDFKLWDKDKEETVAEIKLYQYQETYASENDWNEILKAAALKVIKYLEEKEDTLEKIRLEVKREKISPHLQDRIIEIMNQDIKKTRIKIYEINQLLIWELAETD